jgi:hypothetical protein
MSHQLNKIKKKEARKRGVKERENVCQSKRDKDESAKCVKGRKTWNEREQVRETKALEPLCSGYLLA